MARNEEKHYGRLNRLYLLKEKEEHEKANPKRPRLETLCSVEEVQKWLPSIKKDLDFYLKKSQVTCYSDTHVEECREKVIKLEKEFKAFVRKIKQLNPSPLDAIPWTNRPYKRKSTTSSSEESSNKEFKRIATPILDEVPNSSKKTSQWNVDWNLMNEPLSFSNKDIQTTERNESISDRSLSSVCEGKLRNSDPSQSCLSVGKNTSTEKSDEHEISQPKRCYTIVNYDSSDSDDF